MVREGVRPKKLVVDEKEEDDDEVAGVGSRRFLSLSSSTSTGDGSTSCIGTAEMEDARVSLVVRGGRSEDMVMVGGVGTALCAGKDVAGRCRRSGRRREINCLESFRTTRLGRV